MLVCLDPERRDRIIGAMHLLPQRLKVSDFAIELCFALDNRQPQAFGAARDLVAFG